MGVATTRRADRVHRQRFADQDAEDRLERDMVRALESREACDEWRRRAWALIVEAIHDGGGFLRSAIQETHRRQGRTYLARSRVCAEAHCEWVEAQYVPDIFHQAVAALHYARAVYRLLDWAGGDWAHQWLREAPHRVRRG